MMGYGVECIAGCPQWILALAVIGGIILYALIGAAIYYIVKAFKEDLEDEIIILFIFAWPLVVFFGIVFAAGWYISRLISMPIVGADKEDLANLKREVNTNIREGDNKVMEYLKYEYKPSKKGKVEKPVKKEETKKSKKKKK